MSLFDWPSTLVPRNIVIRPPRKTVGLTSSLSQFTQAVPAIRPPFGLTMEFDTIFDDDVPAWRAILGLLEGRANRVRVPVFDPWHLPAGVPPGDLAGVTVTGVQGQRTISADFGGYGQLLKAGLHFGLGEHPYLATIVSWVGSVATIRCTPTLRTDYVAARLKLRPTMICRLTSDDGGELMLKNLRAGTPTIDLEETFDEPVS